MHIRGLNKAVRLLNMRMRWEWRIEQTTKGVAHVPYLIRIRTYVHCEPRLYGTSMGSSHALWSQGIDVLYYGSSCPRQCAWPAFALPWISTFSEKKWYMTYFFFVKESLNSKVDNQKYKHFFLLLTLVAILYNCFNCTIQFKLNEIMHEYTIISPWEVT